MIFITTVYTLCIDFVLFYISRQKFLCIITVTGNLNILQKSIKQKNPKYLYLILTDNIKNPLHHLTANTYIKKKTTKPK